ncbi:MAG: hypothetical protein ACFFAM_20130 [Promethearchaeota archaeon]
MPSNPKNSSNSSDKHKSPNSDHLHPLERKYGKEPKIKMENLWYWH